MISTESVLLQFLSAIEQKLALSMADAQGTIQFVTDEFCRLSGYSRDEVLGKTHRVLKSNHHDPSFFKNLWDTILSGQAWRGQILNKRKDGSMIWVSEVILPLRTEQDSRPTAYLSIRFDVTQERAAQAALELHAQKTLQQEQLNSMAQVVSGLAHEMNNPLAVILGQTQLIERKLKAQTSPPSVAEINAWTQKIQQSTLRINDLVARIRHTGATELHRKTESVKLSAVIQRAIESLRNQMNENGIQIDCTYCETLVECSPEHLSRLFEILLENSIDAVKELPHKWIRINCQSHSNYVDISVTDSGPGIPAEIARHLMRPFFSTKGVGNGKGLNLSMARGIAESHQGRLVYDPHSANTRFLLVLPTQNKAQEFILDIPEAIAAHLAWRERLQSYLKSPNQSLDPEQVSSCTRCALGIWILTQSEEGSEWAQHPQFQTLDRAHRLFHLTAADIVRAADAGKRVKAETELFSGSLFDRLSLEIIAALEFMKLK